MSERKSLKVLVINSKEDDRQEWLAFPTDADKVRALFDRLKIEPVYRSQGPKADYYIKSGPGSREPGAAPGTGRGTGDMNRP